MNKKNLCKSIILFWLINPLMPVYASSEPPASYLNASELMELYSTMYSSIHNMSVSYTDVIEEEHSNPKTPDIFINLIRYKKVERIEEGDKYYTRHSYSKDQNGSEQRNKNPNEYAFDGSVTMVYYPETKSGYIEPGRTGRSYEDTNKLTEYMLINKIPVDNEIILKDFPDGLPDIYNLWDPQGAVRPHLEQVSGEWCHVVDTIYPRNPGEPKPGSATIWFAADKGGLPMKLEELDGYGKCERSILVKKVAAAEDKINKVWYPQEAIMTTSSVSGTLKYKFVCHELRVNIETNEDTWKLSFPEGTHISDHVSGISYKAGPSEKTEGN